MVVCVVALVPCASAGPKYQLDNPSPSPVSSRVAEGILAHQGEGRAESGGAPVAPEAPGPGSRGPPGQGAGAMLHHHPVPARASCCTPTFQEPTTPPRGLDLPA